VLPLWNSANVQRCAHGRTGERKSLQQRKRQGKKAEGLLRTSARLWARGNGKEDCIQSISKKLGVADWGGNNGCWGSLVVGEKLDAVEK